MIRVLVAEDMRILRDTLVSVLNLEDDIKVVAQVAAGPDIVPAALAERPDLAVLDKRTPRGAHPRAALLIIEVANSSLRYDRRVKAPLYAEAGVPEYWVIDVQKRAVDVFSEPKRGAYTKHARVTKGALTVSGFDDVRVSLAALFK